LKRIELNTRLGKLDSLLLVIPTLFGIAFALSQYYLKTIGEVRLTITLVPILIVSVVYPVYIGYYRGAIKLNSIVERARGWIYVANGFVIYILMTIVWPLLGLLAIVASPLNLIMSLIIVAGAMAAIAAINTYLSKWLGRRILSLFDKAYSQLHSEVFVTTGSSAVLLASALFFLANVQILGESYWLVIAVAILLVLYQRRIESHARELVSLLQETQ